MKETEIWIRRELEELFLKPIIVCIDDKDKFEKKEMMKKIAFTKKQLSVID